jgi:FkbM family methyltransferase
MQFFQQALREGDTVVEVGGHIGYMTMFFSKLVGRAGRVIVFEPGGNNLPYIRANVAALGNVKIVESAVSDTDGSASFFEEALTGQNNSLLGDYERFEENRQGAFSSEQYKSREVTTVRLDTFAGRHSIRPALMKIDIEGAEFMALTGAARMLAENRPMLLVEVTRRNAEVFRFLVGLGYELFTPEGNPILRAGETNENVCALHPRKHGQRMPQWPWARSAAA